ncbi:MAG TPA: sigma-70 family RNA polymerase sigma factor [Nitrospinae bacterium]|nr:sigma-70 family RNA polymerase sigma factor [Nitrospinota bacterium]
MRIDAVNNFLNNPNAEKIRLNGRYNHLPTLEFHDSFIPTTGDFRGETPFPAPDAHVDVAIMSDGIDKLIKCLPKRDQTIIRNYYGAGKTNAEIAKIVGLCVSSAAQRHRIILKRMRETQPVLDLAPVINY